MVRCPDVGRRDTPLTVPTDDLESPETGYGRQPVAAASAVITHVSARVAGVVVSDTLAGLWVASVLVRAWSNSYGCGRCIRNTWIRKTGGALA